ncbi:hypothetical protein SASPL_136027 [Salvia splendens]|uniref:Polyadenylate-binding protein n=1 Tax=Salvia splendens TaxID=180675 RepID=A0A8X8WZ70_SALSN|nr:hypothetical protein SASPL_136027 [Salvia splendens]
MSMALQSAVPATPASLYVGDLHPDVNDAVLFQAFKVFNSLNSVRVCLNSSTGRSPLLWLPIRAIELKNHSTLNGKVIRVMWSRRDPDGRRSGVGNVFVKNLSDSIDSVKLQEMFQTFGDVLSCKVVTSDDGKSRGYCFVQFASEASAKAAIEKLNDLADGGKQMVWHILLVSARFLFVSKFVKKSERTLPCQEVKYTNLYVKNLDTEISEEVLEEKFSQFGKFASLIISRDENGASRGFGFVNFDKAENAKSAVEALNGSQLGSKVLYVARAQKKSEREEMLRRQFEEKRKEQILKYHASNVYVKNIDDDISDDELRLHFSQCGTITPAKIMRDEKGLSRGYGFVCFSTPEEANKAVYTFHGLILRRKPLYVAIAQRKEERQVQLQVIYAQHMAGLSGPPSPVIQGGYSHLYYPAPGVVPQIPAQPSLMYQQQGIRPGWRANGIPNPSRPVLHPMTFAPNNFRQRQRAMKNRNILPQGAGLTYPSHLQRPIHSLASSKDSNNQQPILISAGVDGKGSEMLSSVLAAAPPEQQKHILGERLYPLVTHHQPDLAAKITGMLLEMDNSELLVLLDTPESLAAKVEEAVQVLKLSNKAKDPNSDALGSNYISAGVAVN